MKYNKELTEKLGFWYVTQKLSVPEICKELSCLAGEVVPEKSVIAKLSSLGIYQKKQYLTKRGEVPIRKSEYIEKIAQILEVDVEMLESMEKLNKNVLVLLLNNLEGPDPKLQEHDAEALTLEAAQAAQVRHSALT